MGDYVMNGPPYRDVPGNPNVGRYEQMPAGVTRF